MRRECKKKLKYIILISRAGSVVAAVTDRVDSKKKAVIDAAMAIAGVVIEMVTSLLIFLDFTYVHHICGYEVLGLDNVAR